MGWEMTTELTLMSSFNKSLGHWEHRFTTFLHVLVVLIICVQRLFHLWLLPHTWEMVENWGRNLELFGVTHLSRGFSSGLYGKESAYRRPGFNPWAGKIPWKRMWQSTLVFLPGESHGQRSLVGHSPGGRKEWDVTEWLTYFQFRAQTPVSKKAQVMTRFSPHFP